MRILDSLQPRVHPRGKPEYVPAEAEFIQGDVADAADLGRALARCRRRAPPGGVPGLHARLQPLHPHQHRVVGAPLRAHRRGPKALPRAEDRLRLVTVRLRRGQLPVRRGGHDLLSRPTHAGAADARRLGLRVPVVRRGCGAAAHRRGDLLESAHRLRRVQVRDRAARVQPRPTVRHRHRSDALHVRPGSAELVLQRLLGHRTAVRAAPARGTAARLLRGRPPVARLRERRPTWRMQTSSHSSIRRRTGLR